jgi:protein gp37
VLLQIPAAFHFLSCEPLLGDVDLTDIAWKQAPPAWRFDVVNGRYGIPGQWGAVAKKVNLVIVGGESGPGARACHLQWLRSLVMQCQNAKVPVFVKQLGANIEPSMPPAFVQSDRKGGDWSKFPADLQVREFPLQVGGGIE